MAKKIEEVRDGFLGDLPEDLRIKVMAIHKIIVDKTRAEFKMPKYAKINKQGWAKSWLEEFLAEPTDKNHIGSVRVYRKGKRFRCMIQISGHVTNNRNTEDEELFHGMIRNVFVSIRSQVRRKFDCTITCESEHGEPFEGYDIWTKQKTAAQVWECFEGKKIKKISEYKEAAIYEDHDCIVCGLDELPSGLQRTVFEAACDLFGSIDDVCGFTELHTYQGTTEGTIMLGEGFDANRLKRDDTRKDFKKDNDSDDPWAAMADLLKNTPADVLRERMKERKKGKYFDRYQEEFELFNPGKFLEYDEESGAIEIHLDESYAARLVEYLEEKTEEKTKEDPSYVKLPNGKYMVSEDLYKKLKECSEKKEETTITEAKEHISHVGNLSFKLVPTDDGKQYTVYDNNGNDIGTIDAVNSHAELQDLANDMGLVTESVEATPRLTALAKQVMNTSNPTQDRINMLASVINSDCLKKWAPGYSKLNIKLTLNKNGVVEFKIPKITEDFVARFIEGRESMQGLLHRNQTITMYISKDVFSTIKNPDDVAKFFKNALKYYSNDVNEYIDKLMASVTRLNRPTKQVIATTKLSSIVVCPIQQVFIFDNVSISGENQFKVTNDQISAMNKFVKNITSRYTAPEKEQKAILEDLDKVIKAFKESSEDMQFGNITEAVSRYFNGGYDSMIDNEKEKIYIEQYDMKWLLESKDPDIKYYQEKFGVKKLKKIPRDLVAYITIETEAIRDANDKQMICSYTISKIELTEWYIELLDVGSKKYIVPHTKPYLESLRTQLLACYKKIMDTPVPKKANRPIIDVKYPSGYEW